MFRDRSALGNRRGSASAVLDARSVHGAETESCCKRVEVGDSVLLEVRVLGDADDVAAGSVVGLQRGDVGAAHNAAGNRDKNHIVATKIGKRLVLVDDVSTGCEQGRGELRESAGTGTVVATVDERAIVENSAGTGDGRSRGGGCRRGLG